MPEVSFWLNSVIAEARFNFSLNQAENDFIASSPWRIHPHSLCIVSARTSKSKKRLNLSLKPVLALHFKHCSEEKLIIAQDYSKKTPSLVTALFWKVSRSSVWDTGTQVLFTCFKRSPAAVTRGSWTQDLESPALSGEEQTCIFPWTGIVKALCWVTSPFRMRQHSQENTPGRKKGPPVDMG